VTDLLVAVPPSLALAASIALPLLPAPRVADAANRVVGVTVGTLAAVAAAVVLAGHEADAGWVRLDGQGAIFSLVSAVIGLMSALLSPRYLAHHRDTAWAGGPRMYYLGLYLFWAALLALPLSTNLGVSWVLVEATTGASALLVASSGRRRALEAGWKYLVLTTLGLTVTLSGIIGLYAALGSGGGLATLDWDSLRMAAPRLPHSSSTVAVALILGGRPRSGGPPFTTGSPTPTARRPHR
jgi:hydrogenase-4 component F